MKKLNYLLLGLAGLAMASCSNDDLQGPADGSYQLTVNLPKDIATRAIGDEITANQVLNYTIFTENGDYVDSKTNVSFNGGTSMTLNLPLLKGNSYKIAFFAQSENSSEVYSYNTQTSEVNVAYSEMTYGTGVDADAYDCFSGTYAIKNVSSGLTDNITLTRPVAQINWGTDDLTAGAVTSAFGSDYSNLRTSLSLNTYTTLNVIEGSYGNTEDVTIPATALPATEETFPAGSGYSYLAMQYVLAEAGTAQTVNLVLNVTSSETSSSVTPIKLEVSNAPIRANYRTNIYGSLLTDQANITVSLSADWGGETNLVWDGQKVTIPTIVDNTITTDDPAVIAGIASMVKGGNDLEGVTITLTDDIDMGGYSFPGIGTATRSGMSTTDDSSVFRGTFDGNGKTISNLKVAYTGSNANTAVGFIPNLDGAGTLQNVTFDNVVLDGGPSEQVGIVGLVTNGATVKSVTVNSGSITTGETGGAIVGRMIKSGTISNCHNLGASVTGTEKVGGIVGAAYYNDANATMTIENCTNGGTISGTKVVGGIVGQCAAKVSGCSNSGKIVSSGAEAGGIVAWQFMSGSVKGCTNTGSVTGTGSIVGGIVGNISYSGVSSSYPVLETIVVDGNKNEGIITSAGETGGIVGRANSSSVCSNNVNTSSALNATNGSVAGIIGTIYGTNVLITGNTSSTTLEQMEGKTKNWIYNVSGPTVTPAEGSQPNEQTLPAGN